MPSFNESTPEPSEGWGLIRPGDTVSHYYRHMDALCGRAGFYHGSLEPDENHMPEDCKGCRKVLNGEAMEQGFPGPEDDDDPCSICGCAMHSCAADCDCCPEHREA
jgi:hypothetical protein